MYKIPSTAISITWFLIKLLNILYTIYYNIRDTNSCKRFQNMLHEKYYMLICTFSGQWLLKAVPEYVIVTGGWQGIKIIDQFIKSLCNYE